jgi:hypothetical protein
MLVFVGMSLAEAAPSPRAGRHAGSLHVRHEDSVVAERNLRDMVLRTALGSVLAAKIVAAFNNSPGNKM